MDPISAPDVEAAWSAEIERRLVEIDAGAVELIPWDEVRSELFGDSNGENNGIGIGNRRNGTVSLLLGPETLAKLKAEFE